tara:strand:+ start:1474 stop:2385 length:912 start_codon:yes stop_codon:yes gene_type:complete
MKICFIAPGEIEIPPDGWGALETVVWNQSEELRKLGHETFIINEKSSIRTYAKLCRIQPDIVHLHYGKHYELMPQIKCHKIVTNHDGSFKFSGAFHDEVTKLCFKGCEIFCLSEYEKQFFSSRDVGKVTIMPNGVDWKKFKKNTTASKPDRSICVGKIDTRKRQAKLQKMNLNIDFVGANNDNQFNEDDPHYLGPWSREEIYSNLTEYANFVLFSSSECDPLVCLEALSAGLGLVISEACTESLDLSKEFIDVIPEDKIEDKEYVEKVIKKNRIISMENRNEIIAYGKTRDWSQMAIAYNSYL